MLKSMFVYGTLMIGYRTYMRSLHQHIVKMESCTTKGELYQIVEHNCPGLISGNDIIRGEYITYVDDENDTVEKMLDEIEKKFEDDENLITLEYIKKNIVVSFRDKETVTTAYICKDIENHRTEYISSGDWRLYLFDNAKGKIN